MRHLPVLSKELMETISLKLGDKVIDCTVGDGGHAQLILNKIGKKGKLLAIDADLESLKRSKQFLQKYKDQIIFVRDNFKNLKSIIKKNKFVPVNLILMDLGWSLPQFKDRNRGFSFEKNELLDMRFFPLKNEITAEKIINTYSLEELEKIFHQFGEEKFSSEIAKEIILARKKKSIKKTFDLIEIVLKIYRNKLNSQKEVPWIKGGIHPATKIFQALRIAVNDELEVLKQALPQAIEALPTGGQLAVISFHSLEDRIVKQYFSSLGLLKKIKILTKKPILTSKQELLKNKRARSAKLRVIEKI